MKRLVSCAVFTVFLLNALAQEVLSPSGRQILNNEIMISYTIGEPVVNTAFTDSSVITQGFQQSNISVIPVNVMENPFGLKVFPNPTKDLITIRLKVKTDNMNYGLYDVDGKLIIQNKIFDQTSQIDMSPYASGIYLLKIKNNKQINSFKIIKK